MTTTYTIINKTEFVDEIQKNLGEGATKTCAERALKAVLDATMVALTKTKDKNGWMRELRLIGFGTFKVVERQARKGINPQTGKPIQIKASKSISFKASDSLKLACGLKEK